MANIRVWSRKDWWILYTFHVYFCAGLISGEIFTYWYKAVDNTNHYQTEYNIQNKHMTWWEAAQSGCDQHSGELFTLKSESLPHNVSSILQYGIYWIGAVEFNAWKWTDGSSLYTYEGYTSSPSLTFSIHKTIQDNSALTCHRYCGERVHWFGLKGNTCYCLITSWQIYSKANSTEVRCPGNFYDKCGNDYGMSVYSIGELNQVPYDLYDCGYARVLPSSELSISLSSDCSSNVRKCAACYHTGHTSTSWCPWNSGLCMGQNRLTWDKWNSSCSLITLTPDIKNLIKQTHTNRHGCTDYWIGLRKYTYRKWIDGRSVNIANEHFDRITFPRCLAIDNTYFRPTRPYWTACSSRYKSVCETMKRVESTTDMPSVATMTTSNTTQNAKRPAQELSTRPQVTTSRNGDNVSEHYRGTDTPTNGQDNHDITGIYIGSCIGAVILLIVLLMVILSYRQKWFCFKTMGNFNFNFNPKAKFNVSGDRISASSIQPNIPHATHNSRTQSIPIATVRPIYQTVLFEDTQPDYYNVPPKSKDIATHTSSERRNTGTEPHYEVPVSIGQDDRDIASSHDPAYEVVGGDTGHGESTFYSLGGQDHDLDAFYTVAGETGANTSHSKGIGQHQDLSDKNYDTRGLNMSNIRQQKNTAALGHVNICLTEDHYDTTVQANPDQLTGSAYDHVGGGLMEYSGNVGTNYDTTRTRQVRPDQSAGYNYSHINELRVGEATDWDHEDIENVYHDIDECHIGEENTRSDIPGIGEPDNNKITLQDGSPEGTSYYNVAFTSGSEKRSSKKGGRDDNTYSLART